MSQAVQTDVRELVLSNSAFGPQEVRQLSQLMAEDVTHFRAVREAVQQLEQRPELTPATKVRAGVCTYLLGRFHRAAELLSTADGGALAQFYLAKAYLAVGEYDKAAAVRRGGQGRLPIRRLPPGPPEQLRAAGKFDSR